MKTGIDAPLRLRRTVRVYRSARCGFGWQRKSVQGENFRYTVVHVGWWCINFFTDLEAR